VAIGKKLAEHLKGKLRPRPKPRLRPEVLLCPNVPAPMHGVAPRVIMGPKWWDETRRAAYRSTSFHCLACGVWKGAAKGHRWLEGHELYEVDYAAGTMTYVETVPLCHYCHCYVHDGRMTAELERGRMRPQKFRAVLAHGDAVLAAAGLRRPTHGERDDAIKQAIMNGRVAEWGKWRLVLNGKKHPPRFKTKEAWEKAYAR
jgi:hypothetical protein